MAENAESSKKVIFKICFVTTIYKNYVIVGIWKYSPFPKI